MPDTSGGELLKRKKGDTIMKGIQAIVKKTKNATYNNPVPLYINYEMDTVYTTAGSNRFFLTNLIRENTKEDIMRAINRFAYM